MPSLHYRNFLQTIVDSKAKTRLIIVTKENDETSKQAVEMFAPLKSQIETRLINKTSSKNYQIIDNKEVWIATQQKTETGFPCMLWTNDQNIIDVYKENFKKAWSRARSSAALAIAISSFTWIALSLLQLID